MFFFFKQKTAYEMRISDWSSDVCSSDLPAAGKQGPSIAMSDGTPDRTKTVIACADNIPVLVVSFPPGVNAPPPGEKVMIEIGEPRPGQYANVALQPVKGKTAYIGPQIGGAEGRERGLQYGLVSVCAGSFKKKKNQ